MAKLFSPEWMQKFSALWNMDQDIAAKLGTSGFSAVIGFGFPGEERPESVIVVNEGKVTYAGPDTGHALQWDLRANRENWREWLTTGFGFDRLGVSVASGKLVFESGDYRRMTREPDLVRAFLRHFELMSEIKTEF